MTNERKETQEELERKQLIRELFGRYMVGFQEKHGCSQAHVARKLGYNPSTLTKWLNGDLKNIPRAVLDKAISLFKLDAKQKAELLELYYGTSLSTSSDISPTIEASAVARHPRNYIPYQRNFSFQPRPGEFERVEQSLFGSDSENLSLHIGQIGVGIIGMGGIGKTQLAVEIAYRNEQRFSGGVFWMLASGTNLSEWQHQFAELAANCDYLPPFNNNVTPAESDSSCAHHICRYLATHTDSLLILDNVEDPKLMLSILLGLRGGQLACKILYTSRNKFMLPGFTPYFVAKLPEENALHLLLGNTRIALLDSAVAGNDNPEAHAARAICQYVDYLPLALALLHELLACDSRSTLVRLSEALKQRGALEITRRHNGLAVSLSTAFRLSWENVHSEEAQLLFKLASYWPEAESIPLWLLGLAAGLGESVDPWEPLGAACIQLQDWNFIERLSGNHIRLHPLIREFGQWLVTEDGTVGQTLLTQAGERLVTELTNLKRLEEHTYREGYREASVQVHAAHNYAKLLGANNTEPFTRIERWLDRESYLLADSKLWPNEISGLFYQQIYNRSIEEGYLLKEGNIPDRWIRQIGRAGAEDEAQVRVFAGHTNFVEGVAFSPNGQYILTGSWDNTARLWEVATGKLLKTLEGHTSSVKSVAFSPDGQYILTGSSDHTARLWEVASGQLFRTLEGHTQDIESVGFSPDSRLVLTVEHEKTARVWEIINGDLLETIEGMKKWEEEIGIGGGRTGIIYHRDLIYSAFLWDVKSGKLLKLLKDQIGDAQCSALSSDGKLIITASRGVLSLLETKSGKLLKMMKSHAETVTSVTFSPNGQYILIGSWDKKTACLWEVATGKLLKTMRGHTEGVTSVAFSPDGQYILTGSWDNTARLWKTTTEGETNILEGHIQEISDISLSFDGQQAITGSWNNTAFLWDISSGKSLKTLKLRTLIHKIALSPDSKQFMTSEYGDTVYLWSMTNGRHLKTLTSKYATIVDIVFSPDGKRLLTVSKDRKARLWEAKSGKFLYHLIEHTHRVICGIFSLDGKLVLTGSRDRTACLWEAASGKLLQTFRGHEHYVNSVAFSPDSKLILTCSQDEVYLWETASGKLLKKLECDIRGVRYVYVTFSPDNSLLLACSSNGLVYFWSTREADMGHLQGIYPATYEVGAVHWYDEKHVLLVDKGGPQFRPHFYNLMLEGKW